MWTHLRASPDTRDTLSPRISPKGANQRKVLVDHHGSRSNAEDGINWYVLFRVKVKFKGLRTYDPEVCIIRDFSSNGLARGNGDDISSK
ncbi:hypothetical protein M0802_010188 [Mischocyttarus mexicanus]|nr:hypothetical protein M0802_010188 [Mischocyttarus mexicanus]